MPKDEATNFEVSQSEVAFHGRIWNVIRETFRFGNQSLTREFVAHPGAVAVIAINQAGEILMIRQYRHPVRSYLWEIPAGLLDVPGESKELAAERELLEETGYRASQLEHLIEFFTTPGGNSESITIFLARDLEYVGHEIPLEGEELDLEIDWVPLNLALKSIEKSELKSPSAVVGILALANKFGVNRDV